MLGVHAAFLVLFVGSEVLFAGLDLLNLRHAERTLRAEADWVDDQFDLDVDRLVDYQRASTGLSLLSTYVGVGTALLVLYSGLLADAVRATEALVGNDLLAGVAFLVGVVVLARLASLPFDAVDTFVVEEGFGFNNRSVRLWLRDAAVSLGLLVGISAVVVAALLVVVERLPTLWPVAGTGLFVAFALLMQVVYPRIIAPLFYEFDPVEAGELREAVDDTFERAGFTCDQVYVMDASKRSSKSNAYFVGFGRTKRVVLFDTLVDRMELDELQGVLAHELAHWKRHHVWKQLAAGTLEIAVVLGALWYLLSTEWLYAMFGLPETTYAGLLVGALWVGPLSRVLSPLSNRLSIAHEREADAFAARVVGGGDALARALSRLVSENLSNPFPHPWYAAFNYRHPPVPERIRRLRESEGTEPAGGDAPASG